MLKQNRGQIGGGELGSGGGGGGGGGGRSCRKRMWEAEGGGKNGLNQCRVYRRNTKKKIEKKSKGRRAKTAPLSWAKGKLIRKKTKNDEKRQQSVL